MDNYDELKLKNQICFPLYACSKEVVKRYRPLLDELNLTYTQYIAMMVFWDEKKLNVKELGERLYLDSGTLTPVLKNLESKGYVRRYRSQKDERVLLVEVTNEGMALRGKALGIPGKLRECLNITDEEVKLLTSLLGKILTDVEE